MYATQGLPVCLPMPNHKATTPNHHEWMDQAAFKVDAISWANCDLAGEEPDEFEHLGEMKSDHQLLLQIAHERLNNGAVPSASPPAIMAREIYAASMVHAAI